MPVAPPAAPAAPPAAAQTPPNATPPPGQGGAAPNLEQPQGDWLGEVGAELEEMATEENLPKEQRQQRRQERQQREQEQEANLEAEKEEQARANAEQKRGQQEQRNQTPPDDERLPAPELRKAHKALKTEHQTLQSEKQKLLARIQELESRPAGDSEETKTKLSSYEKRIAEQEQFIRFHDYQQSEDFKKNYQQPYVDAWSAAMRDFAELQVETPDGQARKATEQDFIHLANLPLQQARKEANAMFGDSADDVMYHVRRVRDLADQQQKALAKAKEDAKTAVEQNRQNGEAQRTARVQSWKKNNTELATKYPTWFAKNDADPDGNGLLDKGFALADLVFEGELTPERVALLPQSFQADLKANKGRLSPEKMVHLHTLIRNKAAAFDRLVRQLATAQKELKDAKKTLAEYEVSEPPRGGAGGRGGGGQSGQYWDDDPNAEIDALAKQGR